MADIPENKQKRLMSLNQDVLAVSPVRAEARPPQGEAAPGNQRSARTQPAPAKISSEPGRYPAGLIMASALLACAGLVAGVLGVLAGYDAQRQLKALDTAAAVPPAEVAALRSRIQELEDRLGVAAQETARQDEPVQASLLQTNSRIRKLGIDVGRFNSDLGMLRKRVDNMDERTAEMVRDQGARLEKLAAEVRQLSGAAAASGASAADSARLEQKLAELDARMDKQASDIRSIYRLLEQTR